MSLKSLRFFATLAIALALLVVVLGAYTRLTDAGLGCPDWPGCYGHLVLPQAESELLRTQSYYPHSLIEPHKAWTEMVHRYAAGTLALLILVLSVGLVRRRLKGRDPSFPWLLPMALVLLVAFQAALGMWTVTLKLLPVVVMGHLLGGMLIFSCLCYIRLQLSGLRGESRPRWRFWISFGVMLVLCQVALGGWVSANYAGLACIGFPRCNGSWWPTLHFAKGFYLFSPVGTNYQGGVLDIDVRATIQVIHRWGALVVTGYIFFLSAFLIGRARAKSLRVVAGVAMLMVVMQVTLGVANVLYLLPLGVAVAHNAGAALLLATMLSMRYLATGRSTHDTLN